VARRRRRKRKVHEITTLHWVNLCMYAVVLVIILFSVKMLGDGTASCFYEVSAPADDAARQETP